MVIATKQVLGMAQVRERRKFYERTLQEMKTERASFDPHYQSLNDFILPRRMRRYTGDVNRGERRNLNIVDGTAGQAARNLSAGMMGGLSSPARDWFRVATPFPKLNERPEVKAWLDIVQRRMNHVFRKSNLYNSLPILYKEMGTFATSAMLIEDDIEHVIRTTPLPLGSYYISNNERLKVDWFMREFQMTVRQLVEKFGEQDADGNIDFSNFSWLVQNEWKHKRFETWVNVVHTIHPNWYFDKNRLESKFKKYLSVYYESGSARTKGSIPDGRSINNTSFLSEAGYDQFPVLVGRWETTGEDCYGTDCPGMTALGDIKQLQHDRIRLAQAVDKVISPPMKGPTHLRSVKTSTLPGDMTYSNERGGQQGFQPVFQIDPRFKEMGDIIKELKTMVKDAYFERLFLLLAFTDRREITAREVEEKAQEKMVMLGPVVEGVSQDILDPLIDNTFSAMRRQGLIPPAPPILQGQELRIEYVSIMAQAQKATGLGTLERFSIFVGQLAQVDPTVVDKVNRDELVDQYGDAIGVPPGVINSDEEVAAIREFRAQQQARAEAAEKAAMAASAAKDLSQANLDGDNALSRALAAAQAGQANQPVEGAA